MSMIEWAEAMRSLGAVRSAPLSFPPAFRP